MSEHTDDDGGMRQRAEAAFRLRASQIAESSETPPPEEMQRVLYELSVHQIQLEMQNEALRESQASLDASRARYFDLYDLAPVGYCTLNEQGLVVEANLTITRLLGVARGALLQKPFVRFVFKTDADSFYLHHQSLIASMASGEPQSYELQMVAQDGHRFWANLVASGAQDAAGERVVRMVLSDVSTLKRAEQYEHYRRRILELLAENKPLPVILKTLVEGIEQLNPGALCSILLLDQEGKHLGKGVAPSLPDSFNAALEGVEIGLGVGSCGTAAFTGERVIVADIASHPYWAPYKALAASAGLGACWSQPIRSSAGQVLGTFAIYHRDAHTPAESDIALIEEAASLASIAIDRRLAAEQLQDNEERWKFALEGSGEGVWDWNIQTGTALYSKRWKEMLGFAEREIGNSSSEWSSRVHPDDLPRVMSVIQRHIDGETPAVASEFRLQCKDGRWLWTLGRGMVVSRNSDGQALRLVGTNTDISERKQADDDLREQKEFFHLIAENIGDFIAVLDLEGRRLYNSPSYRKFFGSTDTTELRGTDSFVEIHPDDQARVKAVFRETVETGIGRKIEYRFMTADGSFREIESLGSVIRDAAGKVARVVIVSHDVTERKQMEEAVRQLAFYDALTKLPNRRLLNDRLSQTMAASARNGFYGALMFLDLDNFKPLNDTHGHNVGDLLLIEVADRLRSCVREMDTVVRFGGDEFVVMISELDTDRAASVEQVALIAEKIRLTLSEPYGLILRHEGGAEEAIQYHCTASIGIALFINHEASQDEILMRADTAMYQAKDAGRDRVWFYDENSSAAYSAKPLRQ